MKNANITDIREKLSDYLKYVLSGGTVLLWKRERLVAKIVPAFSSESAKQDSEFTDLYARGLMRPPLNYDSLKTHNMGRAPKVKVDLGRIVSEERDERR